MFSMLIEARRLLNDIYIFEFCSIETYHLDTGYTISPLISQPIKKIFKNHASNALRMCSEFLFLTSVLKPAVENTCTLDASTPQI